MVANQQTLARRLGKTVHVSPLRMRLERLRREFPCAECKCLEDWLVRVANARGARVVVPPSDPQEGFGSPSLSVLSNEELVTAICQPNGEDRPQVLRLAAQLISRGVVDVKRLRLIAERERAECVLAELARQSLRVAPHHPVWRELRDTVKAGTLREPLLHWTRLAEPVMQGGRCNASEWRLVR